MISPVSKSDPTKFFNWSGYFGGMYVSAIRAGTGAFLAFSGTNTVPYSTYTRITGLTLANTQVLKTTGIASGTRAASGDIVNRLAVIKASVQ